MANSAPYARGSEQEIRQNLFESRAAKRQRAEFH